MRPERGSRAFTLVELLVALLVMGVLLSGLAIPIAAQVQLRRQEEARRQLEEARDALLGFAAAYGRLPCPAAPDATGVESFAAGGSAADGRCSHPFSGFLPGAALGLAALDAQGYVRDPWQGPANRLRYAVFAEAAINGVDNALTRANGMQAATIAGLGAAPHYLFICTSGSGAGGSGCGPAANQLTRKAAFVLLSLGANAAAAPAPGSDEARNVDGDAVFVSREAANAPGQAFDDLLLWVPVNLLVHRMVSAGRLP